MELRSHMVDVPKILMASNLFYEHHELEVFQEMQGDTLQWASTNAVNLSLSVMHQEYHTSIAKMLYACLVVHP